MPRKVRDMLRNEDEVFKQYIMKINTKYTRQFEY